MEKNTPHYKLAVAQALWQDVYRPATRAGGVYLKLTVVDDLLIVSFKEL
jgi:motility quorum-sensing regulator/GCU-specific mRNA interferase toxin